MQVTKEQIDPCTVTLDIQIEEDVVSRAFDRAYREFGKYTSVPGFRPGKAPRTMLERYVNQERLKERVMELVAAPAYREALQQEEVTPYTDPEVDFSDLADGQPWQFKATVPTPPQVKLGETEGISVERPVYEVTDEDIDRQIETLRNEHSRLEKIEDRGVQEGDVLIAEMTVTPEGEEPPAEPRRSLVRIGDNIPGFDEAVMGQKIDEERTFELTYPEDHQDAARAGKKANFQVKVASINQKVLPEVTDEWIKSITPFETVQDLRDAIKTQQEVSVKDISDRVAEGRIIEELISRSELEFPGVMVQEEMQEEAHQLGHDLETRKMSYEEYLASAGMTKEQHEAALLENATERVRSFLVLRELAKREGIEVGNDELAAEFGRLAMENKWSEEDARRIIRDDRRRTQVANIVMRRKLKDKLFELAEVKDVPATAE
jgi:trigger factor